MGGGAGPQLADRRAEADNHISADLHLELPLAAADLQVLAGIGAEGVVPAAGQRAGRCIVPIDKRRYLKTSLSRRTELIEALANARLLPCS